MLIPPNGRFGPLPQSSLPPTPIDPPANPPNLPTSPDHYLDDDDFSEQFGRGATGKANQQKIKPISQAERAKTFTKNAKLIDIKTGESFRAGGVRWSLKRQLGRQALSGGQLRFLGPKEREYFLKLVKKHATHLPAGTELPRPARKAMKTEIENYRGKKLPKGGVLTSTDRRALKKLIDTKL